MVIPINGGSMQNFLIKILIFSSVLLFSACSSMPEFGSMGFLGAKPKPAVKEEGLKGTTVDAAGNEKDVDIRMMEGKELGIKQMDKNDKSKMSRALDKPIGKTTEWQNAVTGTRYKVTPTNKLNIEGNPFCREYKVEYSRGKDKGQMSATACVMANGEWRTL